MNKIAVLIDCWKTVDQPLDLMSIKTTKGWLADVDSRDIDTVIVATYDVIDLEWKTPFAIDTRKFVGASNWNKKIESIRFDKTFNGRNDHITNPAVWELAKSKKIFTIHYPWEFPAGIVENINEVYMYGQAWDVCVKERPLGYDFWLHKTNANILLTNKSCKFSNKTYVDYDAIPTTKKVKDNVWQMIRM